MAMLEDPTGQQTFFLHPQTLAGRSRSCDLRLTSRAASGQHALIRWTGEGWELRDLGSRNGTHIDGRRIESGERVLLKKGARVGFGQPDEVWVLRCAEAPVASASCGEVIIRAEGGMLALPPGQDEPAALIYNHRDGRWVVEIDGAVSSAGDELVVEGQLWRLHLPSVAESTAQVSAPGLATSRLRFEVSGDEETTHLSVVSQGEAVRLDDRAHHYLLLTLARRRLEDRADGESRDEEGWMDRFELADGLRMDLQHVNLQIYRARRQLAKHGVAEAAQIVERRSQAGQLRLGVGDIEIVRL